VRNLNKKQKQLLTEWVKENQEKLGLSFDCEDDIFPYDLYAQLKAINDFETLNQAINNFVQELVMA
jgi:hypothetical protein